MTQANSFYRGDDHCLRFEIGNADGDPIDITDWVFTFTMKLSAFQSDEDAGLQIVKRATDAVLSPAGVIEIHLANEDTKTLIPTVYEFDLQTNRDGIVTTLVKGSMEVVVDVTVGDIVPPATP